MNGEEVEMHKLKSEMMELKYFTELKTALSKKLKFKLIPTEMPEDTEPFKKMQANFLYQFLTLDDRRNLVQNRHPHHLLPSNDAYKKYMSQINQFALHNNTHDILSIQMFAGHGMILNGSQVVLTNNFDKKTQFYEFLNVEL